MTYEPCIQLRGITKVFGAGPTAKRAVDGLDLDIGSGEIVALLGPNGAGKTTTLDMVLGFTTATAGTITVLGQNPTDAVRAGRVSAVLQTGGLLRDLRVVETVELIASTYRAAPSVEEVLARAGITELAGSKVQDCSGGEQQRLRFALALLADPDLLILDEPTAGMDVQARQDFWAAMRTEANRGRTIVFATHYLQEAEDFAERTVLIANGRSVADGPTAEIRRQAAGRRLTARFEADAVDAVVRNLRQRSDTGRIEQHEDRVSVESANSDDIARLLLGELSGYDLEIEPASLERAFIQLTSDDHELTGSPS
ncbi:MAG: ABC transporter ATP-binding protein [Actinomycetota bacterium]